MQQIALGNCVQDIPRILWNLDAKYRPHNLPQIVIILNQMKPLHTYSYISLKIHYITILPSTPRSSKWLLSFRFLQLVAFLFFLHSFIFFKFFLLCSGVSKNSAIRGPFRATVKVDETDRGTKGENRHLYKALVEKPEFNLLKA